MSDDRNEGWNHRSEMLDHTDPALGAVSRNVNERAEGPTMTQQEGLAFVGDVGKATKVEMAMSLVEDDGMDINEAKAVVGL